MKSSDMGSPTEKTLRLLALLALDGRKQKEQIRLLDRAGFVQSEIAQIVGSTPKAVSVRLAELRRSNRKGGKSS
jgi:hypothetical protein